MPQRNLLILLATAILSYACYVRGGQNPYVRYVARGLDTIERDSLENVPNRELFNGAMQGMIDVLHEHGDEHSQFIPEHEADPFRVEIRQQFGGIGVRIRFLGDPPRLTIVGPPDPGTPAARANLLPGDCITQIDGQPTADMTMNDVLRVMRGEPGQVIHLLVEPADGRPPETHKLVREVITIDSVLGDVRAADGHWQFRLSEEPRIAYMRVSQFGDKTVEEFDRALDQLVDEGLSAVVLDLRDNTGGALDAAVAVCDMLLPAGMAIVETRGRGHTLHDRYVTSGAAKFVDLPLAVLINQNTASASEIVAACLQDHCRAALYGQRSYGKGTVQELVPVESGQSLLKLTSASYWRPSGRNIHRMPEATDDDNWGVSPDPGCEVKLTTTEYAEFRKYRAERDLLGPASQPDAAESAGFVDRALQRAVEHLRQVIDSPVGGDPSDGTTPTGAR